MKLIVFSDLHGNDEALELFLKTIEDMEYDRLIFCGDIFGYYYGQKEILKSLKEIQNLIWLKGNHDAYFADIVLRDKDETYYIENYGHSYAGLKDRFSKAEAEMIDHLPVKGEIVCGDKKVAFIHGTAEDNLEGRWYPDKETMHPDLYEAYDYVFLGHTHCRMVKEVGRTKIINSGSVGQPRDGHVLGFVSLDTETGEVVFHDMPMSLDRIYAQIDRYDPNLAKLKNVLERMKR